MSQPTPFALSRLLSDLVGREVYFTQVAATPETAIKQMYGIYNVLPGHTPVVIKADLPLLASFAGVLVGLPDDTVKDRLRTAPLDELLRDAMCEVLNIASKVVTTEGRAIFTKMVTGPAYIDGAAASLIKKPGCCSHFNVTVDGYQGGKFTIFAPLITVNVAA